MSHRADSSDGDDEPHGGPSTPLTVAMQVMDEMACIRMLCEIQSRRRRLTHNEAESSSNNDEDDDDGTTVVGIENASENATESETEVAGPFGVIRSEQEQEEEDPGNEFTIRPYNGQYTLEEEQDSGGYVFGLTTRGERSSANSQTLPVLPPFHTQPNPNPTLHHPTFSGPDISFNNLPEEEEEDRIPTPTFSSSPLADVSLPYPCPQCAKAYTSSRGLAMHTLDTHIGTICYWPGVCDGRINMGTEIALRRHLMRHHHNGGVFCSWPGCNKEYTRSTTVLRCYRRHMRAARVQFEGRGGAGGV